MKILFCGDYHGCDNDDDDTDDHDHENRGGDVAVVVDEPDPVNFEGWRYIAFYDGSCLTCRLILLWHDGEHGDDEDNEEDNEEEEDNDAFDRVHLESCYCDLDLP